MNLFENENIENYFDKKAISNSYLNRIDNCYRFTDLENCTTKEVTESEAMYFGTCVHDVQEKGQEYLDKFVAIDSSNLHKFNKAETKVLESENRLEAYLEVYSNANTRGYYNEDKPKFKETVDKLLEELLQKEKDNIEFLKLYKDNIVLNHNPLISNPDSFLYSLQRCTEGINNNKEYQHLVNSIDILHDLKELEIYWNYEHEDELGNIELYPIKNKADRVIISKPNLDGKTRVLLIDFKTHATGIEKSIKQRNYTRQLSLYKEGVHEYMKQLGIDNYVIEVYIVSISTKFYNSELIKISDFSLLEAKHGGWFKTSLHQYYDIFDNYSCYLNRTQLLKMKDNFLWDDKCNKKKQEYYCFGWEELIKLGIESNVFRKEGMIKL